MSADTSPISPARFALALQDLSLPMLHLKTLEIRNSIAHLQYSNDQLKPFAEGSLPVTSPETTTTTTTASASSTTHTNTPARAPDQDCIDAIRENEIVIDRMAERIALIRAEVESRGFSWREFMSADEAAAAAAAHVQSDAHADTPTAPTTQTQTQPQPQPQPRTQTQAQTETHAESLSDIQSVPQAHRESTTSNGNTNTNTNTSSRNPWTDGTFQTGTILSNGQLLMHEPRASTAATDTAPRGALTDEQLTAALRERMRELQDEGGDAEEDGGLHL